VARLRAAASPAEGVSLLLGYDSVADVIVEGVDEVSSKVVKIGPLPVKFALQEQYMPVHPDVFGQKWNLQFTVTPVIPRLIKGNLGGAGPSSIALDSTP
jgi:hypothetical protein